MPNVQTIRTWGLSLSNNPNDIAEMKRKYKSGRPKLMNKGFFLGIDFIQNHLLNQLTQLDANGNNQFDGLRFCLGKGPDKILKPDNTPTNKEQIHLIVTPIKFSVDNAGNILEEDLEGITFYIENSLVVGNTYTSHNPPNTQPPVAGCPPINCN